MVGECAPVWSAFDRSSLAHTRSSSTRTMDDLCRGCQGTADPDPVSARARARNLRRACGPICHNLDLQSRRKEICRGGRPGYSDTHAGMAPERYLPLRAWADRADNDGGWDGGGRWAMDNVRWTRRAGLGETYRRRGRLRRCSEECAIWRHAGRRETARDSQRQRQTESESESKPHWLRNPREVEGRCVACALGDAS